MAHALDLQTLRSQFPALTSGYLYADNAGGSQCLSDVVARLSDYLLHTNVQLGADYSVSVTSTTRATIDGPEAARELFNAESADEVAYGSSSTLLVENLARAMEADVQACEEVIITGEHECTYPNILCPSAQYCELCLPSERRTLEASRCAYFGVAQALAAYPTRRLPR